MSRSKNYAAIVTNNIILPSNAKRSVLIGVLSLSGCFFKRGGKFQVRLRFVCSHADW